MSAVRRPRTTPRDIVRRILTEWGEWECQGKWSAHAERSILGRIGEPHHHSSGHRIMYIDCPIELRLMGDWVQELTDRNPLRGRAIRLRYATEYRAGGGGRIGNEADDGIRAAELHVTVGNYRVLLTRGTDWLVERWEAWRDE